MPQITEIIPQQGFEKVAEQVGAILTLELDNQKILQALSLHHEVFLESSAPYDKAQAVMVNVKYDGSNYEQHTQSSVHAPSTFFIDVYGHSPSKGTQRGDALSKAIVKKYIGMCRYILQSTKYNILLMPLGTIGGVYVESIQMYDMENNQDAKNVSMARLTLKVRIFECQDLWDATLLTGSDTGVKLAETDLGYKYELTT